MDEHGGGHVFWNRRVEVLPRVCVHFIFSYIYIYVNRVIRYTGVDDVTGGTGET